MGNLKLFVFFVFLLNASLAFGGWTGKHHCDSILTDGLYDLSVYSRSHQSTESLEEILCHSEYGEKSSNTDAGAKGVWDKLKIKLTYNKENLENWQNNYCHSKNSFRDSDYRENYFRRESALQVRYNAWLECKKYSEIGLECIAKRSSANSRNFALSIVWNNKYGEHIKEVGLDSANTTKLGYAPQRIGAGGSASVIGYIDDLYEDTIININATVDAKTERPIYCNAYIPKMETPVTPVIDRPEPPKPKLSDILTTMVEKHHIVGRPLNVITAGRIACWMLQIASVSEIDRVGDCGFYWHENHNGNKHTGANHIYIGAGGQSKEIAVDGYEANYHHLDKSCLAKCFTDEGLECTVSSGCNAGGGDKSLSFKIKK